MTEEKIRELALEGGFTYAEYMDVKDLVFDAGLRKYCEENACGNFGKNHACPPDCGTPAQMEAKAKKYRRALVLETVNSVNNIMDGEEILRVRKSHNKISWGFLNEMEKQGVNGMPIMAGPCMLCEKCQKAEGKACRFPEKLASCLSAYCICAEKMADHCNIPYWCGEGKVAFFSIYLLP